MMSMVMSKCYYLVAKGTAGNDIGNEFGEASWVVIRWRLVFLGSGVMKMK